MRAILEAITKPPRCDFLRELEASKTPTLRPAVRVGGRVYAGPLGGNHFDALAQVEDPVVRRSATSDSGNRGYVTERGRFLNRHRALEYALANDLIADRYKSWFRPGSYAELPSEALVSTK